ncbi:MAG: oligoendopeptidase F [Calditrichaeota bacterium]|nr:oligoendopeptidase F [Calditrichota bacterium]MCB9391752.1 oligoendopeptidase F [Calditrichota bacterium]
MRPWTHRMIFLLTLALGLNLVSQAQDLPERKDIEDKYKWDLSDMYKDNAAWDADYTYIESQLPKLEAYKGKVSKSGKDLKAYLDMVLEVGSHQENLYTYANMSHHLDTRDPVYVGLRDRADVISSKFGSANSWFAPELTSIPVATFEKWYKEVQGLDLYKQYISNELRQKQYVLSTEEEKLMSMTHEMINQSESAAEALRNTDIQFPEVKNEDGEMVKLSEGRYRMLLESKDPEVRRGAAIALHDEYSKYKNTFASLMGANVAAEVFQARARGYNSALHMAVDNDNVDTTVYLNLISAVKANLAPLHKYNRLRKEALGLKELHFYDYSAPIVGDAPEYDYATGVSMIKTALQPLGPEYGGALATAYDDRWVDVYETAAKRSGAYSWGSYRSHPYMLLNYHGTLDDVFTNAHEIGHTMHTWYTYKYQPQIYADYAIFVAEVASTFNEALLMDHLLKTETDPEKRLVLVNQYIDNIHGTIIRQTLFAEFELEMHRMYEQGQPLTAESLSELYRKVAASYYEPEVTIDSQYDYTWLRIPHFYSNFYVYKYATSMSAALALSERVLSGGEQELQDYLGFLAGGSSKYPLDLLKGAGVDMSSPQPIEAAMHKFGELVDELEVLLKARKG